MEIVPALAVAALAAAATFTACSSHANETDSVGTYTMGERAPAGPLLYTAYESKWMPQLGQGLAARIPGNRFFLVRITVVNSGSSEAPVPPLVLIADNGERYQELSDGGGVPQWAGYLRRLKPADALSGNIVFDVPAGHYKLEVTDGGQDKKSLIDIPLTFAEAPVMEIPMPQVEPPPPQKPR